jgi:hypothetical protein
VYNTGYELDSLTMQYDSVRVLHGAVPYRDFFNFPTPGTYWVQAILFALFGVSATNAAYLLIACGGILAVATYLLSVTLCGRRAASAAVALFVAFGLLPHWPFPYHHWYACTAGSLVLLAMARWLRVGRSGWLVAAGAGVAVVGLFDQAEGVSLAIAIVWFVIFLSVRRHGGNLAGNLASFCGGALLVLGPVLVYFLAVGGLSQFIYDTLIWPQGHYKSVGSVNNVPPLYDIVLYLFWGQFNPGTVISGAPILQNPVRFYSSLWITMWFVIAPTITLAYSFRRIFRQLVRRDRGGTAVEIAGVASASLRATDQLLLLYAVVGVFEALDFAVTGNRDTMHFIFATVLIYPAFLGFLLGPGDDTRKTESTPRDARGWVLVVATMAIAASVWYLSLVIDWGGTNIDQAFRSEPLIQYIQHHTTTADTIVALPFSEAYFYGRPAAIRYTLLWPGGAYNTRSQLLEAASEIRRSRPKLVIFWPWVTWKSYWSFDPAMMQFARRVYGYGQPGAARRVQGHDTVYVVYTRHG